MLKNIKYYLENSLMGEGLLFVPVILMDRIFFYLFYRYYYSYKFKAYGKNIRWGRNFSRFIIPNSIRISCPGLISIGNDCCIDEYVYLQCHEQGEGIDIYHSSRINAHSHLLAYSKITIHSKVLVAPFCLISSGNHDFQKNAAVMDQAMTKAGPVEIGAGVWLGQNSKILGECFIGENSVVGAGAVVKGHFESRSLLAGVPAKTIKAT